MKKFLCSILVVLLPAQPDAAIAGNAEKGTPGQSQTDALDPASQAPAPAASARRSMQSGIDALELKLMVPRGVWRRISRTAAQIVSVCRIGSPSQP